ncbi:DAAM [Mytilus edulis]|uniref:DAAM n=1 Tax=Mytilus edulis TaxID=6550 RepID=A0A8S3TRF3_MYTED|nr:DAAM [Mytilus edulis]
MMSIGIVADFISTGLQVKQWKDVSEKMKKARKDYQQYHAKLSKELQAIENENLKMEDLWTDIVQTFQNLSIPFKQLVENSTNFSNFSDVIGLPRLPVDTSSPLFSINFNSVTKESIRSQQHDVIQFLKKVHNNMTEIRDSLLARTIMYNTTLSKSKIEETVGDMQSDIKSILQFSSSGTIRKFGDALTLSDMVCTVSILRYDLEEYDYFPINAFRPRCDVNITTFEHWKQQAYTKRKSKPMRDVITQYVNNNKTESLSMLVDAVHNAYLGVADKHIASYGKLITARDVICVIADTFTNFSMYDFVNLNSLQPDCSTVSTGQFNKILEDANKLRAVTLAVKSALDGCGQYKFCPCLSTVASTNNVAEKDILIALHYIDSSWQPNTEAQFCGASGCECLHL